MNPAMTMNRVMTTNPAMTPERGNDTIGELPIRNCPAETAHCASRPFERDRKVTA
jgi:hypothetical protein